MNMNFINLVYNFYPMNIKVCGMREPDNIQSILALKPAWIGFIRYPKSKRYAGEGTSQWVKLHPKLFQQTHKIGVYVHAQIRDIIKDVSTFGFQGIQLHGNESISYGMKLQKALLDAGLQEVYLLRAFGIDAGFDFRTTEEWTPLARYFIFDTKTEKYGGSGKKFNWNCLESYQGNLPFLLSGGIGLEDVRDIHNIAHPRMAGVDINSRFESTPGRKDTAKLETFFKTIRNLHPDT